MGRRWTDEEAERVGRWIKAAREQRGWTHLDVNAKSGVSPGSLSAYENGKGHGMTPKTRGAIENAFGVAPGTLLRVATEEETRMPDDIPRDDSEIAAALNRVLARLEDLERRVDALDE